MTQTLTTLPKTSQGLCLALLKRNDSYSTAEIEHAMYAYQWAAFLFQNEAEWAEYALTRSREALKPKPQEA